MHSCWLMKCSSIYPTQFGSKGKRKKKTGTWFALKKKGKGFTIWFISSITNVYKRSFIKCC